MKCSDFNPEVLRQKFKVVQADMKTINFFKTVLIFMSVCTTFDFCLNTSGLKLILYHL